MKSFGIGFIVLILAVIILLANSLFIVTDKQTAILLRFGEIIDPKIESGLHFKVPILNTVRKFDSRVLTLDAVPQPYFTEEKKRLIVDAFVKWRISDNEQFYITSSGGQLGALRTLLTQRVDEGLRNQFGKRTVQDVISGERDQLMKALTADLNKVANSELGVEVIDVRVKKIELPSEVNDSVYNRMRTERERLAQELRAEGNEIAEEIRANADKERTVILADAYKTAEIIKGEGDADATSTYAEAFNKNPEFYEFTRSLSAYQSTFQNKSDVLLIDPESDFFKYLDSSFGTPSE
ncbi:protease modulator HflC [SAR86 cluster bacterium]|jgi:membrane protease subunit HflC|nr:protease modulator HflC [SAR86 cluster bacterium]